VLAIPILILIIIPNPNPNPNPFGSRPDPNPGQSPSVSGGPVRCGGPVRQSRRGDGGKLQVPSSDFVPFVLFVVNRLHINSLGVCRLQILTKVPGGAATTPPWTGCIPLMVTERKWGAAASPD